ncbi:MAG: argininosuccinate lyase [Bacteroidales bacterium]|nr:argininosuccinate lyase [Bacteroidales bacterium]MBN2821402.1 argininosuccinate lyase [Bacteroidales bacterium]
MKLWDKGKDINKAIEEFTIGRDRELDMLLAPYDVLGSIAHISMLQKVGLLEEEELKQLHAELVNIYREIAEGNFKIDEGIEDVHSQVEQLLTNRLGDVGKKIHSARSRNDQVLLDIKLFSRAKVKELTESVQILFNKLIGLSEKNKDILIPGYTHLQVAMPSSFGLWFGAYAESLTDDLQVLLAAFKLINQNPLGSAAGYGSSFPIDRQETTDLLGFDRMNFNVVYAQMGRGKVERNVAFALGNVASTLSRMAYDLCLFMSQNFGFISLPDEFTTGSSIMPHKKNPDVFELIRAKSNKVQSLANELTIISNNLPSGYFRDMQVIKESYLESFNYLIDCVDIMAFVSDKIKVNNDILSKDIYKYLFSVEEVNKEVLKGVPFREAYKSVGLKIERGDFDPEKSIDHTHQGSIGNLCNEDIRHKFNQIYSQFNFDAIAESEKKLLQI